MRKAISWSRQPYSPGKRSLNTVFCYRAVHQLFFASGVWLFYREPLYLQSDSGGMAEWSMAAVLKTVVRQRTGGSNPSSSASKLAHASFFASEEGFEHRFTYWGPYPPDPLSRFAPSSLQAPPQAGGMSEGFSPTKSRRKRDYF